MRVLPNMPHTDRPPTTDERMGMAWWNSCSHEERRYWMSQAGNSGVPADAWNAFKTRSSAIHKIRG